MDQAEIEDAVSSLDNFSKLLAISVDLQNVANYNLYQYYTIVLIISAHTAIAISSSLRVECLAEQDMVWKIQWPSAAPGSTQSLRCPGEGNTIGYGLAHRSCLSGGIWGLVNATACESAAVQEVRIKVFNVFIYMHIIFLYFLSLSIYNCHTANDHVQIMYPSFVLYLSINCYYLNCRPRVFLLV